MYIALDVPCTRARARLLTSDIPRLEHPVKRFKSGGEVPRESSPAGDLYAGHDHTRLAATPAHVTLKIEKQDQVSHTT